MRRALRSVPALGATLAISLLAQAGLAQAADERPNEDQMFGGGPPAPAVDAGATPAAPAASPDGGPAAALPPVAPGADAPVPSTGEVATERDLVLFGDPNAGPRLSQETAPDDPLKIGGQLYLRSLAQSTQGQNVKDIRFSTPSLVDGYFDARPNDRVRGFVLGRLFFDPTLPLRPGDVDTDVTFV